QAQRAIRRSPAQAQATHWRHPEHRAGRGHQLRLRHRLLQSLSEADRRQMWRLREKAQERARRGTGRERTAEGQGRTQGAEEGGEARQGTAEGESRTEGKIEGEGRAESPREVELEIGRPGQRRQGGRQISERKIPQRACRKVR